MINKKAPIFFKNIVSIFDKWIRKMPIVQKKIDTSIDSIMEDLESSIKPYDHSYEVFSKLPNQGYAKKEILKQIQDITSLEESRWKDGYVSGAIYHGDQEHIDFLNKVYAIQSQSNPLHVDLFPSAAKFESEIVAMTASMLSAEKNSNCCGTVTSGGTESILLAMKTYRDWAYKEKNIRNPEIIVPDTAHAAFDKAGEYFNIRVRRIPVNAEYKADVIKIKKAICSRTIAVIASAITFPHGVIDPIEEIGILAKKFNLGFHVDACLGGFILPWAEKLGYDIPKFDFRLPAVTSISIDTHKYGYAAKGTSVILYHSEKLRRYQYFTATEWPGGLYLSPTFAGSRPGALSAACWAAMVSMGEEGYIKIAKNILQAGEHIKKGIEKIDDLYILGDPLWVIAFSSKTLNIYRILDFMSKRNWNLNGLHKPESIHICITMRHTKDSVVDNFLSDLNEAVKYVKNNPDIEEGMAPVYGMAATLPLRSVVSDLLKSYLDIYYKVKK